MYDNNDLTPPNIWYDRLQNTDFEHQDGCRDFINHIAKQNNSRAEVDLQFHLSLVLSCLVFVPSGFKHYRWFAEIIMHYTSLCPHHVQPFTACVTLLRPHLTVRATPQARHARLWIFLVGAFCLLLLHWFLGSWHDTDRGHERGLMGLATSSFVVLHLMELVSGRSCLGCSPVKMCCDGHTPQHLSQQADTVFPWFKQTKQV